MNEISGIKLADNVLHNCCFENAGKCSEIKCITDSVLQKPFGFSGNSDRTMEDTQATGW